MDTSNTPSPSPVAGVPDPVQVFQDALTGQPAGDGSGPGGGGGGGDVADPYVPIIEAMTAPDAQTPAADAYPLAIRGLLSGGALAGAPSQPDLNTVPPSPQPYAPSLTAIPSDTDDDDQPGSDTPADGGSGPAPDVGASTDALAAAGAGAPPQIQTSGGSAQPPRSGLAVPGKTPANTAGKGPPKVPDYSHFSQIYGDWAKSHDDAPRYVPASEWKQNKPDPTKLEPESTYGPYTRITFHHTGSENTPQSVDDFDMGKESAWHYLARQVKNGFHAETYGDNGDITYHFLIGKDGTIYEGRPLNYEGAHVRSHNAGNIGVAFLGNYSSQGFNDAQVHSAKTLVRVLNHAYGIGQNANGQQYIFTHKEIARPDDARPDEFKGKANQQMDQIKSWSQTWSPAQ